MSLLPVHSFPAAIFLEARVVGPTARAVVSQLGVSLDAPDCSVAIFSRASGVLLVAGVGSYCAYRICTKYLGQRFVYMLLEASHVNQLSSADRRLLYNNEPPSEEEQEEENRDIDDDWRERVSSSAPSQISRMSRFRRSASRGLFAIRQAPRSRDGVLSRRSNSGRTAASGSTCSGRSVRSASLQILWEGGQQWDDEFAMAPTMVSVSRPAAIVQSGAVVSAPSVAPSMGDLCSVFDDVLSVTSAVETTDDNLHQETDGDDEDLLNCTIKCMADSKYMYRSVMDDEIGSEIGSVISRRSSALRRRNNDSLGLWSLASEVPSTSKGVQSLEVSQADSGMSRSFNSKKSSNNRSMFDSAICADLSSDEGSFDMSKLERLSETGLEWDDDGLAAQPVRNGFDWDMESNRDIFSNSVSPAHRPDGSRDLMALACQRYPPSSPQFKLLHSLYHRNRLRRVGGCTEETLGAQRELELALTAALYHRRRIVQEKTWELLEQRLDGHLNTCDFLQRWPNRPPKDLKRQLRLLWDLMDFPCNGVEHEHAQGLEVLLVLESIEVYNLKLASGGFEWYDHDSPVTLLEKIEGGQPLDQVSWHLLSRCFSCTIELIDTSALSQPPETTRFGTGDHILYWLKYGASPLPLFIVPEY